MARLKETEGRGRAMEESAIVQESGLFSNDYHKGLPLVRIDGHLMSLLGIKRNDWIAIRSRVSGRRIYRMAQGCGKITGFTTQTIMLRYEDMLELEPDRNAQKPIHKGKLTHDNEETDLYSVDWTIRSVGKLESIMPYWLHPDSGYQLSVRIAVVSLIVGVLGFAMGILGLLF